jgi:hypothetical protein
MPFDQPTLWMRAGYVMEVARLTHTPDVGAPVVDTAGLRLLRPTDVLTPPEVMSVFHVTSLGPEFAGGPDRFDVSFHGNPYIWYPLFAGGRQVRIPIAFGGGPVEDPPAIVKLQADPPLVFFAKNPTLYPLSIGGVFKFFPEPEDCKGKGVHAEIDFSTLDPRDLEFYSLEYKEVMPLNAKGGLVLPKDAWLPDDLAQRPFMVEIRLRDREHTKPVTATVPFQIYSGTDLIVMFDRSRSMSLPNPATQAPKWAAARDAASLLAELYCGALSPLKTPGGLRLLDEQRIAFGHFDVHAQCPRTIIAPFRPASADKPMLAEEIGNSSSGGAALGDALVSAQQFFGEGAIRRRRHIVVLTDSTDIGAARPLAELGPDDVPRVKDDAERGVVLHHVVYGQPGEAQSADLSALSRAYGGSFQDSASDRDPLDPAGLHAMMLSVLSNVLPIERFDTRGLGRDCVPIESGARRAIFVAIGARDLTVAYGGKRVAAEQTRTTGAFTFVTVDNPAAGTWQVSAPKDAPVLVLLESALRMRCGVSAGTPGEAITVWAELAHGADPVRGADLRANVSRPGESLGELLTSFAQSGELIDACRAGQVDTHVREPGGPLLASARALLVVTPQRKDRMSLPPDGDDDAFALRDEPRAPQRTLLDALERNRDLPFQTQQQSLRLREVRPGRYEAQLPASDARHEGTYTFRLRALGRTADGYAFARDQRTSLALAPIPDARNSTAWIEPAGKAPRDRPQGWLATVQPRTREGKPLGPGLLRNLRIEYADRDAARHAPALRTRDNFDGTYSARFETAPDAKKLPALALRYRLAGEGTVASVPLHKGIAPGRRVRVILNELRVGHPLDRCLVPEPGKPGAKLLKLDVVAAINGNPNRATRTHVKAAWPAGQPGPAARCGLELSEVVFDGHVEPGAALDIGIGETDFDWMQLLDGDPRELRYRQVFRLIDHGQGTHAVPLFEQPDPRGSGWKVSLTVHVE